MWLSNDAWQTIIYKLGDLPWKPEYFLNYRMMTETVARRQVSFRLGSPWQNDI
jgi:hypothetical protein